MTRFGAVMTSYFAVLAAGFSALFHPSPSLIWNASASIPIGPYRIRPAGTLQVGELVVAIPAGTAGELSRGSRLSARGRAAA
jgi:type IV secretory pathway protease TraF